MPRTGLEPAHLSAHAPETCASTNSATWAWYLFRMWMSGKRDSDPRPQPWQGCALPTELFPQYPKNRRISLNAVAKVIFFFDTANFFLHFFHVFHHDISFNWISIHTPSPLSFAFTIFCFTKPTHFRELSTMIYYEFAATFQTRCHFQSANHRFAGCKHIV